MNRDETATLTPGEFEAQVEAMLRDMGATLHELRVQRLEKIEGLDGVYEIDVSARFEAFGGTILVLAECKHHKSPIKREVVQVLADRLRAVGGHKGMIFSTVRFQKGAIEYAVKHGIALVQVADGATNYLTRGYGEVELPPWVPPFCGWFVTLSGDGHEQGSLICVQKSNLLRDWLLPEDSHADLEP